MSLCVTAVSSILHHLCVWFCSGPQYSRWELLSLQSRICGAKGYVSYPKSQNRSQWNGDKILQIARMQLYLLEHPLGFKAFIVDCSDWLFYWAVGRGNIWWARLTQWCGRVQFKVERRGARKPLHYRFKHKKLMLFLFFSFYFLWQAGEMLRCWTAFVVTQGLVPELRMALRTAWTLSLFLTTFFSPSVLICHSKPDPVVTTQMFLFAEWEQWPRNCRICPPSSSEMSLCL